MAKTGRPPDLGMAREKNLKVRLDGNSFEELNEYCVKNNTSMSDAIRTALKNYLDKEKDSSTAK